MTEHKEGSRDHGWAFVLLLMVGWLVSALVATYYFRAVLDTIGG